ncbi:MAG TPA: beta-ketoacyl-ACP reductase [Candidatus Sulfotelmatobacter sp.]|jgi:3-oxoacyl-[acyl-carrier protein] reductase|nr:beta-ketoacyl-ACP reductase [Candidatus Sulfotelmatobacter sp.]
MRLQRKVALITGGQSGLGREAALVFAREGARVAVCDLAADGSELIAAVKTLNGECFYVPADVSVFAQVEMMVAAVLKHYGSIDILINNAGITRDATLAKMTLDQWNQVIGVNLSGVFHCTKAVAPQMIERGTGKIINTSSIVGIFGNFGQTNYAAAKAGLIGMTKTWARELGPKGINVNAVAPGFIATEMVKKMPEKVVQGMCERTPLRRLGEPRDVANAYLFLSSEEADFINGAVLSVDGGLTL